MASLSIIGKDPSGEGWMHFAIPLVLACAELGYCVSPNAAQVSNKGEML
jgi:hypothetical protein